MRRRSPLQEPHPSDVRAAAAGDVAAFERLVRAYQADVWRFLTRFLGDAALAEDVAQDTFLRAYLRLGSFRFECKFSTWVLQIARNAGLDALRARMRRVRLHDAAPAPPPTQDPVATAEVAAALASLGPNLREALLLVEVLGLTYREVAEVTGVPEGTVKSRVFKARSRLAGWMTEGAAGEV
ncbi:MAG: RNA polymerase sigma factor [Acidimicrobiales bacterium]